LSNTRLSGHPICLGDAQGVGVADVEQADPGAVEAHAAESECGGEGVEVADAELGLGAFDRRGRETRVRASRGIAHDALLSGVCITRDGWHEDSMHPSQVMRKRALG
jgi:hypothetical protein